MNALVNDRKTKIVATLGPACNTPDGIRSLIESGVNVFRINFSHGEASDHEASVQMIRDVAASLQVVVGILQDLQGPKIRVGRFSEGHVELREGQSFVLHNEAGELGNSAGVSVTYPLLHRDLQAGDLILLDDGRLKMAVQSIENDRVVARVLEGGVLSNNKGINIPSADLSIASITDKDIRDIETGARLAVDWVALSFVRSPEDLVAARNFMRQHGSRAKLMAKIEKPAAVRHFDEILEVADGIMVARGDLGVELSAEKVPMLQKKLIRKARQKGRPVVTATQMLETMVSSPMPTRAEASDVANAIFDGTDAVMLSAETAVGKYPRQAVQVMDTIARAVESDEDYLKRMVDRKMYTENNTPDAVSSAACQIARNLNAAVLCCFSASGATALRVARNRIPTTVVAISPNANSCQQLALSWGVRPVLAKDAEDSDEMVAIANELIQSRALAAIGERFVITAGVPFGQSGTTNLIRVERVK